MELLLCFKCFWISVNCLLEKIFNKNHKNFFSYSEKIQSCKTFCFALKKFKIYSEIWCVWFYFTFLFGLNDLINLWNFFFFIPEPLTIACKSSLFTSLFIWQVTYKLSFIDWLSCHFKSCVNTISCHTVLSLSQLFYQT